MPEFGALKGFSDSLAALREHWEISLQKVTGQIAKWFGGPRSGNHEKTLLGRVINVV